MMNGRVRRAVWVGYYFEHYAKYLQRLNLLVGSDGSVLGFTFIFYNRFVPVMSTAQYKPLKLYFCYLAYVVGLVMLYYILANK